VINRLKDVIEQPANKERENSQISFSKMFLEGRSSNPQLSVKGLESLITQINIQIDSEASFSGKRCRVESRNEEKNGRSSIVSLHSRADEDEKKNQAGKGSKERLRGLPFAYQALMRRILEEHDASTTTTELNRFFGNYLERCDTEDLDIGKSYYQVQAAVKSLGCKIFGETVRTKLIRLEKKCWNYSSIIQI